MKVFIGMLQIVPELAEAAFLGQFVGLSHEGRMFQCETHG